jgi:hypothetical protein
VQNTYAVVGNPTADPAVVTLSVHAPEGGDALGMVTKTVPAHGFWNSYADSDWATVADRDPVNHRAYGWVEIGSSAPVVSMTRLVVTDEQSGQIRFFGDVPAQAATSTNLYAGLYLRNWPSGSEGLQSTHLVVNNPSALAVDVTITVRDDSGGALGQFVKTIPPSGLWNSYGDTDWQGVVDTDPGNGRSLGWVEISASAPVVGLVRTLVESDPDLLFFRDQALGAALPVSQYGSLFLRGWPAGSSGTQDTSLVVNNPTAGPITIGVRVRSSDGSAMLGSFSKSIPAHGLWNSYGDPDWAAVANGDPRSYGWVEVDSTRPFLAMSRLTVSHYPDGQLQFFQDVPLLPSSPSAHYGNLYLRNWPAGAGSQSTDVVVNNPSANPATLTVTVRSDDGQTVLGQFTKAVPPFGLWNSYLDADWSAVADTDPANLRSYGWLEITSTAPVAGIARITVLDADAITGLIDGPLLYACP